MYGYSMSKQEWCEKNLKLLLKRSLNQQIHHPDDAPEQMGEHIKQLLITVGCRVTYLLLYTTQKNGHAERINQKIWQPEYAMLLRCCIQMDRCLSLSNMLYYCTI